MVDQTCSGNPPCGPYWDLIGALLGPYWDGLGMVWDSLGMVWGWFGDGFLVVWRRSIFLAQTVVTDTRTSIFLGQTVVTDTRTSIFFGSDGGYGYSNIHFFWSDGGYGYSNIHFLGSDGGYGYSNIHFCLVRRWLRILEHPFLFGQTVVTDTRTSLFGGQPINILPPPAPPKRHPT